MKILDELRNEAKSFKSEGKYKEAIAIYKELYDNNPDKWLSWEYAHSLKLIGELDKAIEISKRCFNNYQNFQYNNGLLASLLYEKYYKFPQKTYSNSELKQLYEIAVFIDEIIREEKKSPYELIMIATLKVLKEKQTSFSKEIINILNIININNISDKVGKYKLGERETEYQSNLEFYFSFKTKMLYSEKRFIECISCCEEGLKAIAEFHHDNDIWMKIKRAQSLAEIGEIKQSIEELERLVKLKRHWSIYYDLAMVYEKDSDIKKSLVNFCLASADITPDKMKVGLFQKMAQFLDEINETDWAYKHALFAKKIRTQNEWTIPKELEEYIKKRKNENIIFDKADLENYWIINIRKGLITSEGKIIKILKNGKMGFVSSTHGSYYFQMISSIKGNRKLREGDKVVFSLIDSFDKKKQADTREAIYISLI